MTVFGTAMFLRRVLVSEHLIVPRGTQVTFLVTIPEVVDGAFGRSLRQEIPRT